MYLGDNMDFNLISKVELIKDDGNIALGTIQDGDEGKIFVSITLDKDKFTLLRAGDIVRGIITDKDKVLGFNGLVNRRISGEMPMYEVIYRDLTKIQRREDFRMECNIPVKYSLDNTLPEDFEGLYDGFIVDISGGGIRLLSNEKLDKYTEVLFVFKLNEDEMILKGQIVHVGDNDSLNGMKYTYGVRFTNVTEDEKEIIIKNIFTIMRKRIQR